MTQDKITAPPTHCCPTWSTYMHTYMGDFKYNERPDIILPFVKQPILSFLGCFLGIFAACCHPSLGLVIHWVGEWSDNKTPVNYCKYLIICHVLQQWVRLYLFFGQRAVDYNTVKSIRLALSSYPFASSLSLLAHWELNFCTFASVPCQSAYRMGTCGHTSNKKVNVDYILIE